MKNYRELSIEIPEGRLDSFLEAMSTVKSKYWSRDREVERQVYPGEKKGEKHICFVHKGGRSVPDARLWLNYIDECLKVTNILPMAASSLDLDSYNKLISKFCREIAKPAGQNVEARIRLSGERISLQREMPLQAYKYLEVFSSTANMSTGIMHPLDEHKWFDFVIELHRSGSTLSGQLLEKWLVDEVGWKESVALELSEKLEYSLDLLKYLESSR